MAPKAFSIVLLSLLTTGSASFPVLAETPAPVINRQEDERVSVLYRKAPITFRINETISLDQDMEELTQDVQLSVPIYDSNDSLAIPAGSYVTMGVKPVKDGAVIYVKSLNKSNRVIPVNTSRIKIPLRTISENHPDKKLGINARIGSDILVSGAATLGASNRTMEQLDGAGSLIGAVGTLAGGKTKTKAVVIPKGTTYTVTLESAVFLNKIATSPVDEKCPKMFNPLGCTNSSKENRLRNKLKQ